MPERAIAAGGVVLAATDSGPTTGGPADPIPVLLLHGLTATRRYVVMGSRSLERSGHRVVSYDARGHGASSPAPAPGAYGYGALCADLVAVLDDLGWPRAVLAGASMGAHTILRLALEAPERVAGIVAITPGYDPAGHGRPDRVERWDALAGALRAGGVEGFVAAYGVQRVSERWRETIATAMRQRLGAHEHLDAVADALHAVPRSRPFGDLEALGSIECPVVVVASRDEVDPGHRLDLGVAYAAALRSRLVVEEEGRSPLAWQGGQLSKVIAGLAAEAW